MKITFLFIQAAVIVSAQNTTLLEPTTTTRDPWQCVTENITQFFDVPKPTGSLLTAIYSYEDELRKTCTFTGTAVLNCPPVEKTKWCGIATAIPPNLVSSYSSYGSLASSWWANHSSAASSLASECPDGWYRAGYPAGQSWLNMTIAFADCYAPSHPTPILATNGASATFNPGAAASTVPRATATATSGVGQKTNTPNGVHARSEGLDKWMVVGSGVAAAAVNGGAW